MSTPYQVNNAVRTANRVIAQLLHWGVPLPHYSILTVQGRKSGNAYSLPVVLIEKDGQRWLVSPYGEVNWVKNARAGSPVSLFRAGRNESVHLRELSPEDSAPILKEYATRVPITRAQFGVVFDAPVQDFVAEAAHHPVFLIEAGQQA